MGDLKGHAIPGSFFLVFGLWFAVNCLRRHLTCQSDGTRYVSTATYALDCFQGRIRRLPVEGLIKVFLSAGGMLGELLAHLPVPPLGIVQHATMYFFFLLSGVVDIVMHYGVAIPPKTDYASLVVALVVEGLLFASHIHGRTDLDMHVHMLLVYVIFITAAVIALEAKFNHSAILGMARAYLFMLQGSWFWAVGIILYGHGETNDYWDADSHKSIMQSTIYFSWHCGAHFVFLVVLNVLLFCCFRCRGKNFETSSKLPVHDLLLPTSKKGEHREILSEDDSEGV